MTILSPLSRMRFAGKVCKLGAWLIAAKGLIVIVLIYFVTIGANNGPGNNGPTPNDLFTIALFMLIVAILTSFFSLILYAAGTLLIYMGTEKNTRQESDELVKITSL